MEYETLNVYGANVVEGSYSADYNSGWTLRYRNPSLLKPTVVAKLDRQQEPLPADPSNELPAKQDDDLLLTAIVVPPFVGMVVGYLVGVASENSDAGAVTGAVLCGGIWVVLLIAAIVEAMPNKKKARAELKERTFTRDESLELREAIVEVSIPNPSHGRWGHKFEPVLTSETKTPRSRNDPLDVLKRLAAETHQLTRDIRASDSWRDPLLLAAHHNQFNPKVEEQRILDHIAGLYRAFTKLGDKPRGSTAGAVTASEAYTAAATPLESVLDTVIARVTALRRYRRDLRALDTELEHARTARRVLELDEDTVELFANAVGNEFATRHLDSLSEQTRVMGAAINELVESLNGNLRTLAAFAQSPDTSTRR
ncbi:hypothetical protein [Rhodococcus sp. UNC23MFCrub1.1]|uniref:hypothetical protein n=1 Tax=Rhodococcus sp. UNC23MFCrub1.1 TaxID=1449068 RepID=UPI000482CA39|nr:hypothetical protein [Rhodococcus sp. UNC23MFCrub1.1]